MSVSPLKKTEDPAPRLLKEVGELTAMAVKDVTCWLLPGVAAVEMGKLRDPGASRNPESAAVPRVLDNFQI